MSMVPMGSQKGDSPKTPTLRQYIKQNEGNCPQRSAVKIIFKPNKAPNWSIVTDHNFRVSVLEDNPLHGVITDEIEGWAEDGSCLFIVIDDPESCEWSLALDTNETASWEEKTWGFSIKINDRKPTKSDLNKTRRRSTKNAGKSGVSHDVPA